MLNVVFLPARVTDEREEIDEIMTKNTAREGKKVIICAGKNVLKYNSLAGGKVRWCAVV